MLKSAVIGDLVKAISDAQAAYKALAATHTAKIPGKDGKLGYEYKYADLNDGLDALQGTLNARGVAVVQEAYTVERGIEVVTMLALGEQWMESRPLFMPVSGGAQAVGSAITYGRRYSLFPMVGLAPADDDGREAQDNQPEQPRPRSTVKRPTKVTASEPEPAQAPAVLPVAQLAVSSRARDIDARVKALATALDMRPKTIYGRALKTIDPSGYPAGFATPADLSEADADAVIRFLDAKLAELEAQASEAPAPATAAVAAAPVKAAAVAAAYRRLHRDTGEDRP
jgi:hypothetical protein